MKILTFDIEDWFHILDHKETASPESWLNMPSRVEKGVDSILSLLEETNQPATFFCLGWVAKKYPQIIKAIKDQGHHIASHSHTHQLAFNQSRADYKEDLWESIDTLQQITGQKITTYRAPGFSITSSNLWAFEVLDEFGIKNDCSIFPASRAHGGLNQFSVASPSIIKYNQVELNSLPINTTKILGKDIVYSGGGYFRLLPYWYLSRRFKNDKYVMTYFHPRDFDPDQPLIPGLSPFRRFKSYVGLSRSYEKLKKLLENHEFINVDIAAKEIDWKNIKKVILN